MKKNTDKIKRVIHENVFSVQLFFPLNYSVKFDCNFGHINIYATTILRQKVLLITIRGNFWIFKIFAYRCNCF